MTNGFTPGRQVLKARLAAGLTQRELGYRLRTSHQRLSRIEQGIEIPSRAWLHLVAATLEIDPDKLGIGPLLKNSGTVTVKSGTVAVPAPPGLAGPGPVEGFPSVITLTIDRENGRDDAARLRAADGPSAAFVAEMGLPPRFDVHEHTFRLLLSYCQVRRVKIVLDYDLPPVVWAPKASKVKGG